MIPPGIELGAIAGLTIFLGLPVAAWRRVGDRWRGFLTAASAGILLFILVEIMGKLLESIEDLYQSATGGYPQLGHAATFSALLLSGFALGLLSMAYVESEFILEARESGPPEHRMDRFALMIAVGIGIHNLTEGLAIAQSFAWGDQRLALFLTAAFGLHNLTEGFGIAAPLAGRGTSASYLLLLGAIGGLPTLVGAAIGSYWQSDILKIFSLSLAAGTLLYLVGELRHLGRHLKGRYIAEAGLLAGFAVAFLTEIILIVAGF